MPLVRVSNGGSGMDWISSVAVDSNGTVGNGTARTFSATDYQRFFIFEWKANKTITITGSGNYLYQFTSIVWTYNGNLIPACLLWLDAGASFTISNNRTGPSSYDEVDFVAYKWE